MDSPPVAVDPPSGHREAALRGVAALCEAVDDARSDSQVLQRTLPILRTVLGEHLALDLREPMSRGQPAGTGGVIAPVLGRGRHFGVIRANGFELDLPSAQAFVSAAGRIVGTALALQHERAAADRTEPAHLTPAVEHRLRSSLATIGVAASTLQARRDLLAPHVRDQLLLDIEANVAALRIAFDEVTAGAGKVVHDG